MIVYLFCDLTYHYSLIAKLDFVDYAALCLAGSCISSSAYAAK